MKKTLDNLKEVYIKYCRLSKLNIKDKQDYVIDMKDEVNTYGEEKKLCKN